MVLVAGCADEAELDAQRKRLEAEHAERMRALEAAEIRLLTVAARQRAWRELRERHERVSAIACENMTEHAVAMAEHAEKQKRKRREIRSRRLASAQAPAAPPQERRVARRDEPEAVSN